MEKENVLNFQSYDYEDKTYYLPEITDVKEVLTQARENIKGEDDFGINICKLGKCERCINDYDCNRLHSCNECLLYIDNKKKFDVFNSFLKENNYEILNLKKLSLPITNDELCKAIACIESINETIHKYDVDFIEKGEFNNFREIKKTLPCLKKFVQYLIKNENNYSDVE